MIPDNLKVAAGGAASAGAPPSPLLPGAVSPSLSAPAAPKFFIPAAQPSSSSFSDAKFPAFSDPSPSPVSVLDAHNSSGAAGTDTDDSRPNSVAEAGPALSAPPRLAARQPAAPSAGLAAERSEEVSSSGVHLLGGARLGGSASASAAAGPAPAANGRSSTMDTTGSSISVEEHQANTAKMLSKWLPDRSLGKISPLPWEEEFAYSSSSAATASFHPLFSWEGAGKAGLRSSASEQHHAAAASADLEVEQQQQQQRAAKSRRTSLEGASAAVSAPAAAPAPLAVPSVWGPHSASSIYSPSASTKGTDEAVVGEEAVEQAVEPTPMSKPLFGVRSSFEQQERRQQQQQQQEQEQQQQHHAAQNSSKQETAAAAALAEEQSWESSQGTYSMPSPAPASASQQQQQAAEPAEQQQDAATSLQLDGDSADSAAAAAAAVDPEGSAYSYYPQGAAEPQTEASSYAYGLTPEASGYDYTAAAAAAAPEPSAAAAADEEPSTSGEAGGVFAPWAALVASMHAAGFGSDPAMQSYLAYFEQYGNYLVSSHPNKEELTAQLAAALPAPPAAAAAAAAGHQASPSLSSTDMALVLEAGGVAKAGPSAAAEVVEGTLLSDDELALYGETLYRAELMEAVFASSGLSVGMLLECL